MSFKIEVKEGFLHIKYGEEVFDASALKVLKSMLDSKSQKHILLNLLSVEEFSDTEPLQSVQSSWIDSNLSFVLIVREAMMHLFDEDLAVVPTYQEGMDFYEMEDIQRKLLNDE